MINHLHCVILLFLAASGAVSAQTPHNYAQWEKEIAAFEHTDQTNPPPKGALLFTGSSTIRRWTTLAADFPDQKVLNRGFGGSEIADATHFAPRIIFPYQPRMVLLRAGGNDLFNGKSVEAVFADYKEFVATVHAGLPVAQIVFIAQNPTLARWAQRDQEKALDQLIEQYTKQTPYLKYIDIYDIAFGPDGKVRPELFVADQLHFNAEGYKLLTARVRPFTHNTK